MKPLLQFILRVRIAKIELIEPQHSPSRGGLQGTAENFRYLHLQL